MVSTTSKRSITLSVLGFSNLFLSVFKISLIHCISSVLGIFVYRDVTSRVSFVMSRSSILVMKSVVSFTFFPLQAGLGNDL